MLRLIGRYAAGLLLVAVLVLAGTAVGVVRDGDSGADVHGDVIVVLGAAQYDGRPSAVFQARLDHAAALYRAGAAPYVLTLGGSKHGDRFTEAAAGRTYLTEAGVPASAITAVGVGNDTLVSLRAGAATLEQQGRTNVVLVTDPWHVHRSSLMAADLGLSVTVSPVSDGPSVRSGIEAPYVARETLGTVFYLLTGGSSGLGPEVL